MQREGSRFDGRPGEENHVRNIKRTLLPILLMMGLMFGSIGATAQDGDKPTITIGSKNYTEQIILGNILTLMLEDAGYPVERALNLGGSAIVHQALVNDEIDAYVEYTGTSLVAYLGMDVPTPIPGGEGTPPVSVGDQAYDIVAEIYPEEFGAVWLDPLGFNNTYTMIVTRETAEKYDLQTSSDLQGVAEDMTLGSDQEVVVREDGVPGFEKTYELEFGDVMPMDVGLVYSSLANGDIDIAVGYSTDGRIPELDLVVLEDDLNYFPPYHAAPVVDQELLEEYPEIEGVLNQLAGKIDNDTMARLNYMVDGEGMDEVEVARTFLEEEGIIDAAD